jgi:hypothetical protein
MLYREFPFCKRKESYWEINLHLGQVLFILLHFLSHLLSLFEKRYRIIIVDNREIEGINNVLCVLIL